MLVPCTGLKSVKIKAMIAIIKKFLEPVWNIKSFPEQALQDYCNASLLRETRRGLMVLCAVFVAMMCAEAVLDYMLNQQQGSLYTYVLLGILSVHIGLSCRSVPDIRSLHLLGMTILIVSGSAFVLLAQQSGNFDGILFVSIALLFMVIPLMPWGLREGVIVTVLIYATFTLSTLGMQARFGEENLLVLQFIMIGAGIISLVLVARNASIRKDDIKTHFELMQAHKDIMLLSNKDPLTGAWNRRFFDEQFPQKMEEKLSENAMHYFACLDIDNFKPLNDNCGHAFGDKILQWLVEELRAALDEDAIVIRLGGDEFAVLFSATGPAAALNLVVTGLSARAKRSKARHMGKVGFSAGVIAIPPQNQVDVDKLYRSADKLLYKAKDAKADGRSVNIKLGDCPADVFTNTITVA